MVPYLILYYILERLITSIDLDRRREYAQNENM
jgi:hypothetical protein